MSKMCSAVIAFNFRSNHPVACVAFLLNGGIFFRRPETGPARSRFELLLRCKKLGSASYTPVNALFVGVPVFTCKRSVVSLFACYLILLRPELCPPFLITFLYFVSHLN